MMTAEFPLAVHALVYLSHMHTMLSSETLAENICTHPARVRKVMSMLKKAGLVSTCEGVKGGYTLAAAAEEITLRRIAEATGTTFLSAVWRSGSVDMDCLVASGMAGVMDGIYADLDSVCKKRLESVTVASIERQLFSPRETKQL